MVAIRPYTAVGAALLLATQTLAEQVQFFYSNYKDHCAWGGSNSYKITNHTARGGLCAYIAARNRVYACPAGGKRADGDTCWAMNENCNGGSGTSKIPAEDQITCGKSNGNTWCCARALEVCTTKPGQINVCRLQNVLNPTWDLSDEEAQAKEFAAVPEESLLTSAPATTPTPFSSTEVDFGTSIPKPSSTSSSSIAGSKTSDAEESTVQTEESSAASEAANTRATSREPASLSTEAIVGIVVGMVAAIAIVSGTAIFLTLHKRRQQRKDAQLAAGYETVPGGGYHSHGYVDVSQGADMRRKEGVIEAPVNPTELSGEQRVELPP